MNLKYKQRNIILGALTVILLAIGLIPISAAAAPIVLSISEVQGDGFESPYTGQSVITTGIVTADFQSYNQKSGFYLQDPVGDGNPATSDGVFVYHYSYDVEVGDEISISGKPSEYYGCTQFYKPWITMISKGNPIPEPVELNPPFDDYASDVYYEAREGMLVSVSDMKVVAGSDRFGECAGVVDDLRIDRVFEVDKKGTGELIFTDDASGISFNAYSGNHIKGLLGPLDYSYDEYKILPIEEPEVISKGAGIKIDRPHLRKGDFSIASYNMYNLFDEFDDPEKEDDVYSLSTVNRLLSKHAHAINEFLREPDLIAVQEVENIEILERLTNTDPIEAEYGAVLIEGPYSRAVDVGLLYRKDSVTILSAEARQTCTTLDDGYGPGTDPNFPCPEGTGPLFSRPPLVVCVEVKGTGEILWLVINHFKSKSTYAPYYAPTTPRRVEQAEWVSELVDEIQSYNHKAQVVVLGDFNDFMNSEPIQAIEDGGLRNLILKIKKRQRYTYIYRGVSEVLDHIFITKPLKKDFHKAMIIHFNPDYPYYVYNDDASTGIRSSDHDIPLVVFKF